MAETMGETLFQTEETAAAEAQAAETSAAQALAEARSRLPVSAALQSPDAHIRVEARASAKHLLATLQEVKRKKESVEAMMALLLQETRAARRRRYLRTATGTGAALLLIWLIYITRGEIFQHFWWIIKIGAGAWVADKAVNKRREAASALSKAGDPRAVGVLALALRDGDSFVRNIAGSALRTLLPRVRASDTSYITPDQMNALLSLAYDEEDRLRLKIPLLLALQQIGDERALPAVEHLLYDPSRDVRRAAKECLPFVTERVRRARESATLLRASSATSIAAMPDQLLRPASGAPPTQTPADQLLRPMEPQPDTQAAGRTD
ncbi:MAG TPA: hypothetical protein VFB38_27320 [Chthonomonadaceae bacterium]|nr:hypothetical protein [Chthonomonadaceae bacterium]